MDNGVLAGVGLVARVLQDGSRWGGMGEKRDMSASSSITLDEVRTGSKGIKAFFVVQLIGLILLQKFAIPIGGEKLELCLPIMLVSLVAFCMRNPFRIEPIRMALLAAFFGLALIGEWLGAHPFSMNAMLVLLALYACMCIRVDVSEETYLECMNYFLNAMLWVAAVVVVQHAIQLAQSAQAWPNLDKILPRALLMDGYNYLQPLKYGARFYKPNAVVFLEVSLISQFTALAVIIELVYFARIWRLAVYAGVLVAIFAGTGLLLLALAAPVLALKLPPKRLALAVFGLVVVAVIAVASGWFDQIKDRIFEFQHQGTSGYYRFTMQFLTLRDRLREPDALLVGLGAGSTPTGGAFILVPPVKLVYEYGTLQAIIFFTFFLYSIYAGAPSQRVATGFLLLYVVGGGGLAVPVYVLTCVLFCSLLRVSRAPEPTNVQFQKFILAHGSA